VTAWLAIMLIASMPWNGQYWPSIIRTPVVWSNTRCHHDARACYYDGTVYLQPEWGDAYFDKELRNAALHEMQHHMQCQEQIWRTGGGWPRFLELSTELVESGALSEHQAGSLKALLDVAHAHEAHASLPVILDGHIPPQFAAWYPWFDLEQTSWISASQENAPRPILKGDTKGIVKSECAARYKVQPVLNP